MRGKMTHILLTGCTGYIGGSVLTRLLSHSLSDTFGITVLLRDKAKAREFRTLCVKPVLGSNSDHSLLRQLAADADVVFACANADDAGAARAILAGLKDRFEKTGVPPTLIHTSGTGVLVDDSNGLTSTENVYSDLDIEHLESLAPTQPHRDVDLTVVNAGIQGYVKTYIILPSTIYGLATGPLVDLGLQNAHSQQIPMIIKLALQRGQVGYVGLGKNVWPHVHIKEVTDLFILIFDKVISNTDLAHGRNGFYFAENGEYIMLNLAKAIAQELYNTGKLGSPVPSRYTDDEMRRYFPNGTMFGTNSRCTADRSRDIGWRPRKGYQDLISSLKGEVRRP